MSNGGSGLATGRECPHFLDVVDPSWCSLCREAGRPLPPPLPARPPGRRRFLARFESACSDCGGLIEPGDLIQDDPSGDGWAHAGCVMEPADA